jgi:hypothetical protein
LNCPDRRFTQGVPYLPKAVSGESEIIGYSAEGRPLVVHYCGNRGASLRIFILAGQHGDESDARDAAAQYLVEFESAPPDSVYLAVLKDGNPDGAVVRQRRNASHMDLNRDHLLLSTPETQAVHSFVGRWQPHLIIDVHTYRAWRPELLQHGFVFAQDVMIDVPTNPAVRLSWPPGTETNLFEFVKHRLAEEAFRCDRYTLVRSSGIIRHSTLDILDARNMLSLRYGVPTVLLEGRRSSPDDPPIFPPPHVVLLRAIEAVVEWAGIHAVFLQQPPDNRSYSYDVVPVRCRYADSNSSTRYMEMQSATEGDIHVVPIPGPYLSFVKTIRAVYAPSVYAVPHSSRYLLEILARHNFMTQASDRFRHATHETCRIAGATVPAGADSAAAELDVSQRVRRNAQDFVLFPTRQPGGRALALLLDPESQFGVHRFPTLDGGSNPVSLSLTASEI